MEFAEWRSHVDSRLDTQDRTLNGIDRKLDGHITATKALTDRILPIVDDHEAMRGGIKVLGWIGKPLGWAAAITAGVATAWATWHGTK